MRWAAAVLAVPIVVLTASPVLAAEPDEAGIDVSGSAGCSGTAVSFDDNGDQLGFLTSKSGLAASQDAPLVVAQDGTVKYAGRSQEAITDNSSTVRIGGIPVKSDSSDNAEQKKATLGTAQVSDYLPVSVTGLFLVDVEVTGAGGAGCAASTWVKLAGNGWTSVNGLVGLALAVLGLVGVVLAWPTKQYGAPGGVRSHGLRGALSGAVAGLGVAMLLVSLSVLPFGTFWVPLAIVAGGLLVGLLVGKVMPARGGAAA